MLSNAYFLAKFRFDTAENEPAKNLQNLAILRILLTLLLGGSRVGAMNALHSAPRIARGLGVETAKVLVGSEDAKEESAASSGSLCLFELQIRTDFFNL